MSNEEYYGKILYNKQMSEDWLSLLEDAPAFNRFDLKSITALLSAPCELGTLVLREEEHSFHDRGTLETLKSFYQTHRFFDYSMTRRCFKVIDGFSSYKVPFVNWHFALCPLESPENGMWVNPLEVYQIQTIRGVCFAELRNGVIIELPIQKRSFMDQAEKAIYSLCYLRREYSITLNYKGGPLDYFQLPVTPFLLSLRNRPLLQHWVTDRGVFHQRYLSEVLRKHQEKN